MSQAPSMPMFWDAYLADTTHLATEEHGAYLLLLAAMWRRNGWVPDDDRDVARILGLTVAKWKRTKERLRSFLIFENGQISQKNLLKIWKNTQEKIEKNRKNGAKGGRPKSFENNDIAKANGSVSDNPNESIPEPEPEPYEVATATSSAQQQREASPGPDLVDDVMAAVGLTSGKIPTHWLPPGSMVHVTRWVTDLGLTPAEIIAAARSSRQQHTEPPRGPKALDGVMQSLAKAKAAGRMVAATDPRGEAVPTIPRASPVPPDGAVIPSESFPDTLPPADPKFATR